MSGSSKSSGALGVQSAALTAVKSILTGVCITQATAEVVVTIYDNTAASGKKVFAYTSQYDVNVSDSTRYINLPDVRADVGLFVVVTGTGAEVIVHYK